MTNADTQEPKRENLEVKYLDSYKEPGESWKKARLLEHNDVINNITPEQIYDIAIQYDNPRDMALFVILYFTAGRVEEVVRYQKIKWGKKKVLGIKEGEKPKVITIQDFKQKNKMGEIQLSIQKKDIRLVKIKGIPCALFKLRNLKNRNPKEKIKFLPVKLNNPTSIKLWRIIDVYLSSLQDYEELFPFGIRNAERILNQAEWNPHSLRAVRLTHLVRYENYTDQKLKVYAGWTDSRPSKNYIKLNYEDLV